MSESEWNDDRPYPLTYIRNNFFNYHGGNIALSKEIERFVSNENYSKYYRDRSYDRSKVSKMLGHDYDGRYPLDESLLFICTKIVTDKCKNKSDIYRHIKEIKRLMNLSIFGIWLSIRVGNYDIGVPKIRVSLLKFTRIPTPKGYSDVVYMAGNKGAKWSGSFSIVDRFVRIDAMPSSGKEKHYSICRPIGEVDGELSHLRGISMGLGLPNNESNFEKTPISASKVSLIRVDKLTQMYLDEFHNIWPHNDINQNLNDKWYNNYEYINIEKIDDEYMRNIVMAGAQSIEFSGSDSNIRIMVKHGQ